LLPASAPAAPPAAPTRAPSEQSQDKEQQYRADCCIHDRADHSGTQVDTDTGQKPTTDKGTDDPDKEVAKDSEAGASNDFAGQPAGDDAHNQYDQQALIRHVHCVTSAL
jgi:hypothetical protein